MDAFSGSRQTFIERLYRGANSYADRLTHEELDAIHVDLGVDSFLLAAAADAKQIVVTGNPGDGKTHLIERLRPHLEKIGAVVITDANAATDVAILDAWHQCRSSSKAFVLAINEWPLYVLRRLARHREFTPVDEALRQVTSARFYVASQNPEPPRDGVVVIDLSLRNVLCDSIVSGVISRLTADRFFEGLNQADPALANREALMHPQVQSRLLMLMSLVSDRLGHVTMRQLVGFIAYLITGGQTAAERIKAGQDPTSFSYANLVFDGGVGSLFDGVRQIFDPAAVTHPDWDNALWTGDTDPHHWIGKQPPGPLSLPEPIRASAYRAIKRRFFFEHASGDSLISLVPGDEQAFLKALREGDEATSTLVRQLVLALNRFFEPDCPDSERDRLQLWQSHRYDVRPPSTFVALHQLSYQQLSVLPQRFADWVSTWLPEDQRLRRSFALVAHKSSAEPVALLDIDRQLFLTLVEAERGLGRSSWSRITARRVTRFIDGIQRAVEQPAGVQDVRVRNVDSDLDDQFSIRREPARYQL